MTTESFPTPPNPLDAITSESHTDIGMRREENQDSYGVVVTPGFRLFMVADGMGGVRGGATASKIAVSCMESELKSLDELTREKIVAAVTAANNEILKKATEEPELSGMGTTLVALGFTSSKLYVTNVGDSRAYRIRQNTIEQLTEDHTLVNELVRSGSISSSQAQSHPVSHMLTRSLGPAAEVEVDCFESVEPPLAGDLYLLCSDGLYNLVSPREIAEVVASFPLFEVGPELISIANLRGGPDNITVIAIQLDAAYSALRQDIGISDSKTSVTSVTDSTQEPPSSDSRSASNPTAQEQDEKVSSQPPPEQGPPTKDGAPEASVNTATTQSQESPTIQELLWEYRYPILIIALSGITTVLLTMIFTAPSSPPAQTPTNPAAKDVPLISAPPLQLPTEPPTTADAPAIHLSGAIDAPEDSRQPTSKHLSSPPPAIIPTAPSAEVSKSRPEILGEQIQDLESKLQLFDQPISGKTAQLLGDSLAKIGETQNQRDSLSFELDGASAALNKWVDIKHRLTDKNQVDLASEAAPLSAELRDKLEVFRRATWNYLQASEGSESASAEHQARLEQLAKSRNDALTALGIYMKEITEKKILESDAKVKELTLERYELNEKISALQAEISFHRVLVGSDTAARSQKRREIEATLQKAQEELRQLQQIPGPTTSPQEQ